MTLETKIFRTEVAQAYEQARADPSNYDKLPDWEALPVDLRCAFIHVYGAGAQYVLRMLEQGKASDSVPKGAGV
jgi:hypothetical protein